MFPTNSMFLACRSTNELRDKRTRDTSFPPLKTHLKVPFHEIRVYRLPSNHSRPRETYPGEHPNFAQLVTLSMMLFWLRYTQTNTQTKNFKNFCKALLSVEGTGKIRWWIRNWKTKIKSELEWYMSKPFREHVMTAYGPKELGWNGTLTLKV